MNKKNISLGHGAGGKLSNDIVKELFLPFLENEFLSALDDSAIIPIDRSRLAFTTDSYVVKPLFFPGGDIGRLSVCGTVNDLAMVGARPLGISAAFILEEGFPMEVLERVLSSIKNAAMEAKVMVVAGDTKVVEHGAAEGLFITTSGVGIVPEGVDIRSSRAVPGDVIIINGPIGDHEIGILLARGEFSLKGEIKSDCAPLNSLVQKMLKECPDIHVMRDPTRGGLGTVLWEIANASDIGIIVDEKKIKVRKEVRGVCDLLGFDPYYLANEGKLVAFAPEGKAGRLLEVMKADPLGRESVIIGKVVDENRRKVLLKTHIGGHRLLEPLSSVQFPRIC
ncbi:MAG TPA: hydrogenase expression/formation protein HypE [Desulfatiglandales bacterium]|nr:hydrogenase expression/formation protein HypE [Desulfatiglandales bacterium]